MVTSRSIPWRIGVEIELLAPKGKSRLDLAQAISHHYGGSVKRFFHPQTEPSLVPGTPVFHNLTLGFEVLDKEGKAIAQCVDDLTLQADLNRSVAPKPDWYRIVSDDERLLRLVLCQADPNCPLDDVLEPLSRLFSTEPKKGEGGMIRVDDLSGASIAIAAPLPGERERPCELITSAMESDQGKKLDILLELACDLGFRLPFEGATHIHFDATTLQSAHAIANLVNLYSAYGDILKSLVGTNPNCIRLGNWPVGLSKLVNSSGFRDLCWVEAQALLKSLNLTKYCDLNLVNCINGLVDKNTVEVRIMPSFLDSEPILNAASLFVGLFELSKAPDIIPLSSSQSVSSHNSETFLRMLPLSDQSLSHWMIAAK